MDASVGVTKCRAFLVAAGAFLSIAECSAICAATAIALAFFRPAIAAGAIAFTVFFIALGTSALCSQRPRKQIQGNHCTKTEHLWRIIVGLFVVTQTQNQNKNTGVIVWHFRLNPYRTDLAV